MVITCLKELKKRKKLKYEDTVIFTVSKKSIKYEVTTDHLRNKNSFGHNDQIFAILEIDRIAWAVKNYGYPIRYPEIITNWPYSKKNDYAALTRLVEALYRKIEGLPLKIDPKIDPITSRFEILDLR